MKKIVFFDVETSGTNPAAHEIIQIAAIAVESTTLTEMASFGPLRVKFEVDKADPDALKINHYDTKEWEGAVSQSEMVREFGKFLREHASVDRVSRRGHAYRVAKVAGHNINRFDIPFLSETFRRFDEFCPIDFIGLDTLQLAVWHYFNDPDAPANLQLGTLCKYLDVDPGKAHDAMSDVRATIQIAKRMIG